jgi:hypothetical protein
MRCNQRPSQDDQIMSKAAKKRAHKAASVARASAAKQAATSPSPRLVVDKPTDWKAET